MRSTQKPRIGVIGGSIAEPSVLETARSVGEAIAKAGAILVCGGRGGVMEAACRGAKSAGGLTLGILPGDRAEEANAWVDIPVVTGLGEARNVLIARTAQAIVALPGGTGTLSEIAFSLNFGRRVIAIDGWESIPEVETYSDPEAAVARALEAAREIEARSA
ncbi:MAG: TIGR00725 family protein [Gemmatimonadetes bacterium]|nr:TIGR00725 family protein [Gemmatimonadota bacterium]